MLWEAVIGVKMDKNFQFWEGGEAKTIVISNHSLIFIIYIPKTYKTKKMYRSICFSLNWKFHLYLFFFFNDIFNKQRLTSIIFILLKLWVSVFACISPPTHSNFYLNDQNINIRRGGWSSYGLVSSEEEEAIEYIKLNWNI